MSNPSCLSCHPLQQTMNHNDNRKSDQLQWSIHNRRATNLSYLLCCCQPPKHCAWVVHTADIRPTRGCLLPSNKVFALFTQLMHMSYNTQRPRAAVHVLLRKAELHCVLLPLAGFFAGGKGSKMSQRYVYSEKMVSGVCSSVVWKNQQWVRHVLRACPQHEEGDRGGRQRERERGGPRRGWMTCCHFLRGSLTCFCRL